MKFTLLSLLLLYGCQTTEEYWHVDMPSYRPEHTVVEQVANLNEVCKQSHSWNGDVCIERRR